MNFVNDSNYFDQHFLIDNEIIMTFIKSAKLNKKDIVVEIGPGKGNISKLIANRVKKLYCIELDCRLKPYLSKLEKQFKNVEIIYDNALTVNLPICNKIVTSVPYSIIEPLINKLIHYHIDIYMIMGKKYVDNVINNQITKLSLLTNCFYNARKIIDITPEKFEPKPRVMSSIIELKFKAVENVNNDTQLIFRYMYYFKNKKVKNALIESLINSSRIKDKILTQKSSKNIVGKLNITNNILNKTFEEISNNELKQLYEEVEKIIL